MEKINSKRIENLEFRRASYLLPEDKLPEHMSYHIDYWYPNPYYGNENKYLKVDSDWYQYNDDSHCRVHKDCFKYPQSCFAIASFDYDEHEDFYELRFVGDRPLNITKEERDIFWELIQYGNEVLNKSEKDEE